MGEGEPIDTDKYILSVVALGFALADLDCITIGMFLDIVAERQGGYEKKATQRDFDTF